MEQMGMTDKQFNGFIRFLIDDLKEAKEEEDTEKKNARIQKILENLWKIKKEQYNNSSDTQERAELATALK